MLIGDRNLKLMKMKEKEPRIKIIFYNTLVWRKERAQVDKSLSECRSENKRGKNIK